MSRWLGLVALCLVTASSLSSEGGQEGSVSKAIDPELIMAIERGDGAPDVVQVSVSIPEYGGDRLRSEIESMATSFGGEPIGLHIMPATADGVPLRAVFSLSGVIDRSSGDMRLQPIVRSFLSGTEPHIQAFSISFRGVAPVPYTTLASYDSPVASLRGYYDQSTQTLEYRVLSMTSDPSELVIPTRYVPATYGLIRNPACALAVFMRCE